MNSKVFQRGRQVCNDSVPSRKSFRRRKKELKDAQKAWRDMTDLPDYPDINFPLYIPSFLKVKTFSTHTKSKDR